MCRLSFWVIWGRIILHYVVQIILHVNGCGSLSYYISISHLAPRLLPCYTGFLAKFALNSVLGWSGLSRSSWVRGFFWALQLILDSLEFPWKWLEAWKNKTKFARILRIFCWLWVSLITASCLVTPPCSHSLCFFSVLLLSCFERRSCFITCWKKHS